MGRDECGVVLLEVLVAMTILTLFAAGATGVVAATYQHANRATAVEEQAAAADRLMTELALLTRSDLDIRLGSRRIGRFATTILRPEPELYRIAVASAGAPDHELLVTVVFRPRRSGP